MKKIFLLFSLGILLIACSKKPESPKEPPLVNDTVWISQAIKDIILFKKGSFWVYKDSISGIIDTTRIDSISYNYHSIITNPNNTNTRCHAQACLINYISKIKGKESFLLNWDVTIQRATSNYEYSNVYCTVCNISTNFGSHLDSLRVNNITYFNIKKQYNWYSQVTGYGNYYITDIYHTTKDWGIIRREYLKTSDVNPTIHEIWLLTSANLTR